MKEIVSLKIYDTAQHTFLKRYLFENKIPQDEFLSSLIKQQKKNQTIFNSTFVLS